MNIIKHLWHFFFTKEHFQAAMYGFVIGFDECEQRRIMLARDACKVLCQNIVNANGYSAMMVPNLTEIRAFSNDREWDREIEPNYFEHRTNVNRWRSDVERGEIVVRTFDGPEVFL